MIRLHLVVEGQTEEAFVRDLLSLELAYYSIIATAHSITTSKKGRLTHRGGFLQYAHMRKDLELWMKQDRNSDARFSTMIDLYRMPCDFPGFDESRGISDPLARARFLENKLAADLSDPRFLPYIQVHEFEALLFSDPSAFSVVFPDAAAEIAQLVRVAESAVSPEHIDDGPNTSPAKQIETLLPSFSKTVHAPVVASHIGLGQMRQRCKHFDEWYGRILATPASLDLSGRSGAATV
jgi:hypothetical protein